MKKIVPLILLLTVLMLNSVQTFALESDATVTQALNATLEDESKAFNFYQKVLDKMDSPIFTRISQAEERHLNRLKDLMAEYDLTPVDLKDDATRVAKETLSENLQLAIEIEKEDIALYEKYLAQALPDDVQLVFEQLKRASERHLEAFERILENPELDTEWNCRSVNRFERRGLNQGNRDFNRQNNPGRQRGLRQGCSFGN